MYWLVVRACANLFPYAGIVDYEDLIVANLPLVVVLPLVMSLPAFGRLRT